MSPSSLASVEFPQQISVLNGDVRQALSDLESDGYFVPVGGGSPPYILALQTENNRLILKVKDGKNHELPAFILSFSPYRRLIQDYFTMIDAVETARRSGMTSKIESVDMARRGLHNEGAELLRERLKDKVDMDFATARRLFTLICALHGNKIFR